MQELLEGFKGIVEGSCFEQNPGVYVTQVMLRKYLAERRGLLVV